METAWKLRITWGSSLNSDCLTTDWLCVMTCNIFRSSHAAGESRVLRSRGGGGVWRVRAVRATSPMSRRRSQRIWTTQKATKTAASLSLSGCSNPSRSWPMRRRVQRSEMRQRKVSANNLETKLTKQTKLFVSQKSLWRLPTTASPPWCSPPWRGWSRSCSSCQVRCSWWKYHI